MIKYLVALFCLILPFSTMAETGAQMDVQNAMSISLSISVNGALYSNMAEHTNHTIPMTKMINFCKENGGEGICKIDFYSFNEKYHSFVRMGTLKLDVANSKFKTYEGGSDSDMVSEGPNVLMQFFEI